MSFAENPRYVVLDVHNRVLPDDGDVRRGLPPPPDLVDHLGLALPPSPRQLVAHLGKTPPSGFLDSAIVLPTSELLPVLRPPGLQQFSQLGQTAAPALAAV